MRTAQHSRTLRIAPCCVLLSAVLALGCGRTSPDVREVGGYVLVYGFEASDEATAQLLVPALRERLKRSGFADASVRLLPQDGQVEISLPGAEGKDVELAKRVIPATGLLEFRVLAKPGMDDALIAAALEAGQAEAGQAEGNEAEVPRETGREGATRWVGYDPQEVVLEPDCVTRETSAGDNEVLVLLDKWNLTGAHLQAASPGVDAAGNPCLSATLTPLGTQRMQALSGENLPQGPGDVRRLGILLDNQLLTAPSIQSRIGGRFQITGQFSDWDIHYLVAVLRSGRLPVQLRREPLMESRLEPAP